MPSGRPGENPDIADYAFQQKHEWSEPYSAIKSLRFPPKMAEFIKEGLLPDWQEICRRAITSHLPAEKAAELNWPPSEE